MNESDRRQGSAADGIEIRVRRLIDGGRPCEAIDAATTAVALAPLRESAQRALVRAHLAAGDLCEARAAVQRYAQVTRRELGAEPAHEFWAMVGMSSWTHRHHSRADRRSAPAADPQHLVLRGRARGVVAQAHR
ncbi:bacterial transcriptional activator domain-containing protein [Tsukamurella sp. 1534]|uniref:bacterial transcriptional activator domain-containing protein n=1 Tax=Tsukamurella sp. 1534 TaxID=1151061 RepID=UPI0009DA2251|nr:bacterial transcriptional activator domain-containing protein [Tsukamurella sp. 1534]